MKADFLFARPSFRNGVARLFDFWGLYDTHSYNNIISYSAKEADAKALADDWAAVGKDLSFALKQSGLRLRD